MVRIYIYKKNTQFLFGEPRLVWTFLLINPFLLSKSRGFRAVMIWTLRWFSVSQSEQIRLYIEHIYIRRHRYYIIFIYLAIISKIKIPRYNIYIYDIMILSMTRLNPLGGFTSAIRPTNPGTRLRQMKVYTISLYTIYQLYDQPGLYYSVYALCLHRVRLNEYIINARRPVDFP